MQNSYITKNLVTKGKSFTIKSFGNSMLPFLYDGDVITVKKVAKNSLKVNDIVCFVSNKNMITHRIVYKTKKYVITKGDNNALSDEKLNFSPILGRVEEVQRKGNKVRIDDIYLFQSTIYFSEIKKIKKTFEKNRIDYVFLKGLPLHLDLSKKHPHRIYADSDILVAKKDYIKVTKILESSGYIKVSLPISQKHLKIRDKIVEESYVKVVSGFPVVFDMHLEAAFLMTQLGKLDLLYPQKFLDNFSKMLLRSKRLVKIEGESFNLLSLETQIIYLFLHLFHHNFEGGYRYDILGEILKRSFDSDRFFQIIKDYKLENFIYPTFLLLQKYYPDKKYKKMISSLKVLNRVKKYSKKRILKKDIFETQSRINGGVNRFLLIFNLSPSPFCLKYFVFFNKQVFYSIFWIAIIKAKSIFMKSYF